MGLKLWLRNPKEAFVARQLRLAERRRKFRFNDDGTRPARYWVAVISSCFVLVGLVAVFLWAAGAARTPEAGPGAAAPAVTDAAATPAGTPGPVVTTLAPAAPAAERPVVGVVSDPGTFAQAVATEWALTDYKWHYADVVKRSVMDLGDGGGADLQGFISRVAPPSDGKCQDRTAHPIPCFSGAWRTYATVNSAWVAKSVSVQPGDGTRATASVEGVRTVCTDTVAGPGATRGAGPAFKDLAEAIGQGKRGCFDEPVSMVLALQCEKAPVGCWVNDLTSWKVGAMIPGSARLDGSGELLPAFAQTEVPAWER